MLEQVAHTLPLWFKGLIQHSIWGEAQIVDKKPYFIMEQYEVKQNVKATDYRG
jgi:hypothetical protein